MGMGLFAGCGDSAAPDRSPSLQPISVMTRNLYLGADLTRLFFALTPDDLRTQAGAIWQEIESSRFEERAVSLAAEIAEARPDVVALQEVSLFRTQTPGDWVSGAAPNATDISLDFLPILLAALSAQDVRYQVSESGAFTDQEIPARTPDGTLFDVRLTDRNVTLVREEPTLPFASGPSAQFNAAVTLPIAGAGGITLKLERGYVATDVTVGANTVRVVNTHLEVGGPLAATQEAQARELLAAMGADGRALILAGDLNSPPDASGTATYARLIGAGAAAGGPFRDAWQFRKNTSGTGLVAGGTCCLALMDPAATPDQRIDLILFRGGVQATDAWVIPPQATPSGLWPSDHLGVVAQLQIP